MPATQRLNIASVQPTTVATNQITVTFDAASNADTGYAVTLQAKTAGTSPGNDNVSYQVNYDGHPVTLTADDTTILFKNTEARSTSTTLQISSLSAPGDASLALTVISQ